MRVAASRLQKSGFGHCIAIAAKITSFDFSACFFDICAKKLSMAGVAIH